MSPGEEDDDGPRPGSGSSLDADGRFVRIEAEEAAAQAPPADDGLELGERAGPRTYEEPAPYRAVAPARRAKVPLVLGLGLLLVVGGGVALVLLLPAGLSPSARDGVRPSTVLDSMLGSAKPAHLLVVQSSPEGATVRVAGTVIGTTPFAGDGAWAPGTPVQVTLDGHAPWNGVTRTGGETMLQVKLKKR